MISRFDQRWNIPHVAKHIPLLMLTAERIKSMGSCMDQEQLAIFVAGLDADAEHEVRRCWPHVHAWLSRHLRSVYQLHKLHPFQTHQALAQAFLELERQITRADSKRPDEWTNGRRQWYTHYLQPLATQLNCYAPIREQIIHDCWRHGHFDIWFPQQRQFVRLKESRVRPKVYAALKHNRTYSQRVSAFKELCRDDFAAQSVAQEFRRVDDRAVAASRHVLLTVCTYGPIGCLKLGTYPYTYELLYLQRQFELIAELTSTPDAVIPGLRADLVALRRTLDQYASARSGQHLVHEPAYTRTRLRLQAHLKTGQPELVASGPRSRVIAALTQERQCTPKEAGQLLDVFVMHGAPGLIDLRCGVPEGVTQQTLIGRRIRRACEQHLAGVKPSYRQQIETRLMHLWHAIEDAKVAFPLHRLLQEYPHSSFRIRFGRRLWFGIPAIMQRKQHRFLTRQGRRRIRKAKDTLEHPPSIPLGQVDMLVTRFAERADIAEQHGRYLIRNLIGYGTIGLLPESEWREAISEPLVDAIHFARLSRLDGDLDWSTLLTHINNDAPSFDVRPQPGAPVLSRQLARAIAKSLDKPSHWHAGIGEAVARVRKRKGLALKGTKRILDSWSLHHIELDIDITNIQGHVISTTCHALVVLDDADDLPVGCWMSPQSPTSVELGLAMYQAIWQPGGVDEPLHLRSNVSGREITDLRRVLLAPPAGIVRLPLRGTPKRLRIPQKFAAAADALAPGAVRLMTEIKTFKEQPKQQSKVVEELGARGTVLITRYWDVSRVTAAQAQEAILLWLRLRWFPNHRDAEIPDEVRKRGFAMPAHNSPAAGWLLPRVKTVNTIRNAIVDGAVRYQGPTLRAEPGEIVHMRRFPYLYPGVERGVFVEQGRGEQTHLHYLLRDDEPFLTTEVSYA